jgi:hypothetical protein
MIDESGRCEKKLFKTSRIWQIKSISLSYFLYPAESDIFNLNECPSVPSRRQRFQARKGACICMQNLTHINLNGLGLVWVFLLSAQA